MRRSGYPLNFIYIPAAFLFVILYSCSPTKDEKVSLRFPVDTVGFAHKDWQTDSIITRIVRTQSEALNELTKNSMINDATSWKVAISPHDDHTYVGYLYPAVLNNIKAGTIILFGVAHRARNLGLEDKIIFDSYDFWQGPYGRIKVSPLREKIISELPQDIYEINDEMQKIEHSVEALLPFLQHRKTNIEIVSILVPYMSFKQMRKIASPLAHAIHKVAEANKWQWGKDYAFVISTDAVHYGDQEWGGKDFAYYGTDEEGYKKALSHEYEIINNCLTGMIQSEKIKKFTEYTVKEDDHREYKWTWCGRYSVPLGLLTAFDLMEIQGIQLNGRLIGYATSIDHSHIEVDDLGLGTTANAHQRHWVGYAAVGFE